MVLCFLQYLSTRPSCCTALGPISTYCSRAHLSTFQSYIGNAGRCKNVRVGSGRSF